MNYLPTHPQALSAKSKQDEAAAQKENGPVQCSQPKEEEPCLSCGA